jgi:flagellar capping protein FliD
MIRQWALTHQELSKRLDALEQQYGQKFSDIEQVLNYLIQKDQKTIQQGARKEIGFKK